MAKPDKGKASTVLLSMTPDKFMKHLQELKDLHGAADDANMAVATGYKSMKKLGMNLDALKLVNKLVTLGNPAKVAAYLADFDRMRELAGLDAQLNLFEADKTAPQRDAEADKANKVVPIKPAAANASGAEKHPKGNNKPAKRPVTKKALFDTGTGNGASDVDPEIEQISEEQRARQDGMVAGKANEDYANPFESGPLRDAWHSGYVEGSESASAEEGQKASA